MQHAQRTSTSHIAHHISHLAEELTALTVSKHLYGRDNSEMSINNDMNLEGNGMDGTTKAPRPPVMYLVIANISKYNNIRSLLQVATAFGCRHILVVGQKQFDMSPDGSDVPRYLRESIRNGSLTIQRFDKWDDLVTFLHIHSIRLIGVEIHEKAQPIGAYLDYHDTAFLMGNEGQGLSAKQMDSCNGIVRVPQYGVGTASLNVYVAASIILQRFHMWQREA
jgi:tRNA G18 (ribose-2'-O)-methylase SpoU